MARNQKLTGVIKGRTITGTQNAGDRMTITFDDGSTMVIKTAGNTNNASTGGKVRAVRQQDTALHLDFENDTTLDIPLAAPTSSVMLRDKNHVLEYAD